MFVLSLAGLRAYGRGRSCFRSRPGGEVRAFGRVRGVRVRAFGRKRGVQVRETKEDLDR